jgi:membrane protease subunit (stomatin/prohibitin family)
MGLIKAAIGAISGNLADQWLDAIQPEEIGPHALAVRGRGQRADRRSSNKKGTPDYISRGSRIVVPPSTALILTDGGAIGSFTAEPGYFQVDSGGPSLFSGDLEGSIMDTWERFKFGGNPPVQQIAVFINLREIRDVKFGTSSPVTYFDEFYQAELALRAHGAYSFQITDPLLFFKNVMPPAATNVTVEDIQGQLLSEFMSAFQAALSRLSVEGYRISHIPAAAERLNAHMDEALDAKWRQLRGMEIMSTAVSSISYTDESQRLVGLRSQGAMMSPPGVAAAFAQTATAEGLRAAGSNPSGALGAFAGVGVGGSVAGPGLFGGAPPAPSADGVPHPPVPTSPAATHGPAGTPPQGAAPPSGQSAPGAPAAPGDRFCPRCGTALPPGARFCPSCGAPQG